MNSLSSSGNNVLGLRGNPVATKDEGSDEDFPITFCKEKRVQPFLRYNPALTFNPFLGDLKIPNDLELSGDITGGGSSVLSGFSNITSTLFTGYATGLSVGSFGDVKSLIFGSGSIPGGVDVYSTGINSICWDNGNNRLGLVDGSPSYTIDCGTVDAIKVPSGLTSDRPTPVNGLIRYNQSTNRLEGYANGQWKNLDESVSGFTTTINFSQTDLVGSFGEPTYSTLLPTPIGFLETSITPSSSSSSTKILISVNVVGEFIPFRPENTMFYLERTINSDIGPVRTYLRSTQNQSNTFLGPMGIASPSINYQNETITTMESCRFQYIDTPETTENITYRLIYETRSTILFILNRCVLNTPHGSSSQESGVSCILAEELQSNTYKHAQTDVISTYSGSSATPYAISSMTTTVTPTSSSDKVKISVSVFGEFTVASVEYNHMFLLQRQVDPSNPLPPAPVFLRSSQTTSGAKGIAPATISYSSTAGTTGNHLYMEYIDDPNTTLPVEYTLYCESGAASTFKINTTATGGVTELEERGVSTMLSQLLPTTINFNYTQVDTIVSYPTPAVRTPFDISALSTTITPSSTSNRYIKITAHICGEWNAFGYTYNSMFLIKRNQDGVDTYLTNESCINVIGAKGISPCNITYHNDANSTIDYSKVIYIDKVTSTSPITYTVNCEAESVAAIFKLNSTYNASTSSGYERGISNLIVEEVQMP